MLALLSRRTALYLGAPGTLALQVAEFASDRRVFAIIPQVAVHRLCITIEGFLILTHLACEVDDGAIGLELGEAGLENLASALASKLVDEVDGHVVGR